MGTEPTLRVGSASLDARVIDRSTPRFKNVQSRRNRPRFTYTPALLCLPVVAAAFSLLVVSNPARDVPLLWAAATLFVCLVTTFAGRASGLTVLLVVTGLIEPMLVTINPTNAVLYVDTIVLIGVVTLALYVGMRDKRGRCIGMFALMCILIIVAALRAPTRTTGIYQAREVLVGVGLVFSGYAMYERLNFRLLCKTIFISATCTVAYMVVELARGPLIDPSRYEALNDFTRFNQQGARLPENYYFYYLHGHEPITRLGGFLLNPPATGLFLGGAAVLASWQAGSRSTRYVSVAIFALATLLTWSRAGLLVIFMGLIIPVVVRWGRSVVVIAVVMAGLVVKPVIASAGNSASHLKGIEVGLVTSVTHPVGIGFGHVGNVAKAYQGAGVGESLVGLLVAGAGVPALALILWLLRRLISYLRSHPRECAFGLGWFAAASLSESTASLSATAGIWLVVGLALRRIELTNDLPRWPDNPPHSPDYPESPRASTKG